ncbi:MAG: hypothetical protein WA891_07285 [Acidobacteriaceae bacterium]
MRTSSVVCSLVFTLKAAISSRLIRPGAFSLAALFLGILSVSPLLAQTELQTGPAAPRHLVARLSTNMFWQPCKEMSARTLHTRQTLAR